MNIRNYYENVKFRIRKTREIKELLYKVIREENMVPGDLLFILADDTTVLEVNREFLKHDYYTDVISFNNSVGDTVNGEIYISIDTVKRNAREYGCRIIEETVRVMIHGVLHLCGYEDTGEEDRIRMFERQEMFLERIRGELQ